MGKKQPQDIHQELPKFKANEGKSSQKLCIVLILEFMGLYYKLRH